VAERVVLHIGGPKCGTTYLQTVLWANKPRLAEVGVLVPGDLMFQHNQAATRARTDNPRPRLKRLWKRLVDEVNAHPGTAVFSNEWFTMANAEGVTRLLTAFGDAEVHVVFTARDLRGLVPAAWQEQLKLGHGQSLPDFIAALEGGGRWSWSTLDPAEVLPRWELPTSRIHVVTLPVVRRNPTELWDRFASVVGIPEGTCDLAQARPNESVGVVAARLLEQVGPRLRSAIDADNAPWTEQYRWLRRFVSHELLVQRPGVPIGLSADQQRDVRKRSITSVARLRDAGYHVVGDLDELMALEPDPQAVRPEDVTDAELLDAAYDLIADLLAQLQATADRDVPVPGTL
jgi:hypothetical protein